MTKTDSTLAARMRARFDVKVRPDAAAGGSLAQAMQERFGGRREVPKTLVERMRERQGGSTTSRGA